MAYEVGRAKLLMTLPGVAHAVAISLLAALGVVNRFKDGDHSASYIGLTPSPATVGVQTRSRPYHESGRPQTRAVHIQAAQAASDHPSPIGATFRRLQKRKVAVIAMARKVVAIAYLMLKINEPCEAGCCEWQVHGPADAKQKLPGAKAPPPETPGSPQEELYRCHRLNPCQTSEQ